MRVLRVAAAVLLGSSVLIGVSPSDAGSAELHPSPTIDDLFVELNDAVPGFGGLYFEESAGDGDAQTLVVWTRGGSRDAALAVQQLGAVLLSNPGIGAAEDVRALAGDYEFRDLKRWQTALSETVLGDERVVFTDADERHNRVTVGVMDLTIGAEVVAVGAELGIPEEAFRIEEHEPFVQHDLQDFRRPVVGGQQISSVQFICSLGFNANGGFFLTNSHCSDVQGQTDGTVFGQPLFLSPIGQETNDPPLAGGAPGCPAGRLCRHSDAAVSTHSFGVSWDLGQIADPSTSPSDPDDWNGVDTFRITDEVNLMVGDAVTKVGARSGQTSGNVVDVCIDVDQRNPDGTDTGFTMLCETITDYSSTGGDSGRPVFRSDILGLPGEVHLAGIHWGGGGGTAVFSPIRNGGVEHDLGFLNPCDPPTVC